MPVGLLETKEIILINDGKFPLEFEIEPQNKLSKSAKSTNKLRKKSPVSNKKRRQCALVVGNFGFGISSGVVQPNTSLPIEVDFLSQTPSSSEEEVIFKIKNDIPNQNSGILYKLMAKSFVQGIITNDFA